MKKHFTTGEFAKLANVTVRTIRYYDKQGLLKPSFVMDNGYRQYSEDDFMQLQRIISLKQLGFSLDEIKAMNMNHDAQALLRSLDLQITLLDKKIQHSILLKDALIRTQQMMSIGQNEWNWNKIIELIHMSTKEEKIIEHYRNANMLSIRIHLHERYSINKQGWFPWLFSHMDLSKVNRLLELGCGSGDLWKQQSIDMRNREIFLSDISEGMLSSTRDALGEQFNYMQINANQIPFKHEYFDAVIANHMLFYLKDLQKGLKEIARVLKDGGIFYCSTYSKRHMKEISELVKEFDEDITLSDESLSNYFGLENGQKILYKYFKYVQIEYYEDALQVYEVQDLFDYIISCHGNQLDALSGRMEEFHTFLQQKMKIQGTIHITKDAGLFICTK